MKKGPFLFLMMVLCAGLFSCSKDDAAEEPMLIVKFRFDENQARLNNLGQPSGVLEMQRNHPFLIRYRRIT